MEIGLVLNILDEEYQLSIFGGIKKRAAELGIDLFCIQQESTKDDGNTTDELYYQKYFFDLDGIILLSSVMADCYSFSTKEDIEEIWGKVPVISVGQEIEGVPSILVQTDYSMKQLVEHLIINHHYKNFVFLAGPENHQDAIQRKNIFLKTMDAYKPWFPELRYTLKQGHFSESSAQKLMNELYEENPDVNPDVVICSTDNMAIGVYKFFKMHRDSKNIKECAVTGFDDIPQARFEIPSITTVQQPLHEMGVKAVDDIVRLINGEELKTVSYIESKLIFRESCGCKIEHKSKYYERQLLSDLQTEYIFSEQMLRFITHFQQDLNRADSRELLRFYIDANIADLGLANFSVLLFNKDNKDNLLVEPLYVKNNGIKIDPFNDYQKLPFSDFIQQILNDNKTDSKSFVFKYLSSSSQIFGCVMYDAKVALNPYVCSICVSLAQSITRVLNHEEKLRYSEWLEEEVNNRTKELVEANTKRMEVEAEVLHISELERQRFSNDLHDDICQRLAGISMLCRSYSNQSKNIEKTQMVELAELISDTLQTTRQYAHNSYPVELESLGLNYAISNLCNSFEKQTGIKNEYNWAIEEDVIFNSTQKLNIFRIIQEALHNILKHAKAKNVQVSLESKDQLICIYVKDDGCGVDRLENQKGLGINSMKYRANQIGASFEIKPNTPNGTVVSICINMTE